MSHDDASAYGLWMLVILNSVIFIIFAFSFSKPQSPRDWRSFGAFSAFIVALFTEMYGFPLTIYLLSGWLQTRYPGTDLMSHNAGHLWFTLFGLNGDPHFSALHLAQHGGDHRRFFPAGRRLARALCGAEHKAGWRRPDPTAMCGIRSMSGSSSSCSASSCSGRPCLPC